MENVHKEEIDKWVHVTIFLLWGDSLFDYELFFGGFRGLRYEFPKVRKLDLFVSLFVAAIETK